MSEDKVKYIETSEHSMIAGSAPMAPGGRLLVDEDNDQHKGLLKLIQAQDPSVEHLSLIEVDPGAEKEAAEEKAEMLKEAEKIAAEQRNEEARKATEQLEERLDVEEAQSPHADDPVFPPQDEASIALAKASGAGQRASTQEDVAEEDQDEGESQSGDVTEGGEAVQQQSAKSRRRKASS